MELPSIKHLQVSTLGPCTHESPVTGNDDVSFVDEERRILVVSDTEELRSCLEDGREVPSFEAAGPRRRVFFDCARLTCGIVTCGGLCPGLNDVVRSIVRELSFSYGVRRILGFRFGFAGLARTPRAEPLELTPQVVESIHVRGGTILGSSRGPLDVAEMVDTLVSRGVAALFVIGGDGSLRGASAIHDEITRRGLSVAVVGIPKTIDNDLLWMVRTFGFATAVSAAHQAINAAHNEATGAWNGIGLVKLMGRHSGFIAANAALASADVNYCLIPEVPVVLEGYDGFLSVLERRIKARRHAVVVVAEGVGQEYLGGHGAAGRDASGNVRLADIGVFLKDRIRAHFAAVGEPVTIKYIDPSYTIRSLPANAFDSSLCLVLGQLAAHAGMAGKTNVMIGMWNRHFTHVPLPVATVRRKQVEASGELWQRVLDTTGQPLAMFRLGGG